jgi:Late embryogenesis abundant protein
MADGIGGGTAKGVHARCVCDTLKAMMNFLSNGGQCRGAMGSARTGMLAGIFVGLLLLGGCSTYSDPRLSLSKAEATERTADGLGLMFTLDAENRNDVALPLREVEYTLELNGQSVFTGTRSAEQTLRRLGSQQIRLPAVVNLARSPGAGELTGPTPFRLSGTMKYVTPGQIAEILFDQGVRVPSVAFSQSGEVDLSAARSVSLAQGVAMLGLPNTAPPPASPVTLAEMSGGSAARSAAVVVGGALAEPLPVVPTSSAVPGSATTQAPTGEP